MKIDGRSIGLFDVLRDPARLEQLDPCHIPALLTALSAVQASVAARLMAVAPESTGADEDTLLDVEDAANRLGVSTDWLYRRTKELPFVVHVGRHVRFSSKGIARYITNRLRR
jgi:predicted DNA-binding transcriptional regulator AlpA